MPIHFRKLSVLVALLVVLTFSVQASAQQRNTTWGAVTNATTAVAVAGSLLMPRIAYSSPEATVGWKGRWHVSVLAPVMTQMGIAFLNEAALKEAFKEPRPGCSGVSANVAGCESYALFSTQSLLATAALGQGLSVFLFDTIKYSGGRFHGGSFVGHVISPLLLAGVTVGGRAAGDYETFGQSLASAGVGLVTGALMGVLYASMQAPNCGYSGALVCW
jgi:hypothetical protein